MLRTVEFFKPFPLFHHLMCLYRFTSKGGFCGQLLCPGTETCQKQAILFRHIQPRRVNTHLTRFRPFWGSRMSHGVKVLATAAFHVTLGIKWPGGHELPFLGISSMRFQSCFSPEHLICVKGFRCLPQREDGFRSHREKRWRPGVS